MPPAELFAAAGAFLSERGFQAKAQAAFVLGGRWDALEMARGAPTAFKAKNMADYPTHVRIEWDRGRVVIAAQVQSKNEKQEKGVPRLSLPSQMDLNSVKAIDALACILSTITYTLESLLSHRNREAAEHEWALLENGLAHRAQTRKGGGKWVWIVVGIAVLAIVLAVITISNSR